MRSIIKFLLSLIVFIVSVCIVGGTIALFLNKSNIININEYISDKPIVKYFVSEETYQDTVNANYENFKNQLKEKDELINQQQLTIQQLESNLDSLNKDYKKLEVEVDSIKKDETTSLNKVDVIAYYNNMKEKKAAEILNNMKSTEVANIISKMESEKVSKILENMDVQKAAEVTLLLNKLKK